MTIGVHRSFLSFFRIFLAENKSWKIVCGFLRDYCSFVEEESKGMFLIGGVAGDVLIKSSRSECFIRFCDSRKV